jgi:P4 family phage/plasmid primase-like protien
MSVPNIDGLKPETSDDEILADLEEEYDGYSLTDSHLGHRVAAEYLRGRWVAWGKSAWSRWDGRRWEMTTDTAVLETVRRALLDIHRQESQQATELLTRRQEAARKSDDPVEANGRAIMAHRVRMSELEVLLKLHKIKSVATVARGVLEVRQEDFDNRPDLLNVGNGVVDLTTGQLLPHSPEYMFTKITEVDYHPGATHPDWAKALEALPQEPRDWMHARFGQAATGHAAPDDIIPFLKGGGSNGKSTILTGVSKALGDFCAMVPDKLLLANTSDHPTELMTLKGARLAYIEELPEGDYLNAQRLKKAVGTEQITARYIAQNNVSWWATHSLMVTTNYDVQINDVTHGTWRRVAQVRFPYEYGSKAGAKPADASLRNRLKQGKEGQHRAILAWIVEGARAWYEAGCSMPEMPDSVRADTAAWRYDSNLAARFVSEALEPAEGYAMRTSDVFQQFGEWLKAHGMRPWNDRTFWSRAAAHEWFEQGLMEKKSTPVRTKDWDVVVTPVVFGAEARGPVKAVERLLTGARLRTGEE